MRRSPLTALLAPLLLALMLSACARSRPVRVRMSQADLKAATAEQLIALINSSAARIQTLNATVDITASTGGSKKGKITEYQEIRGYILARKPDMLRMVGLFPVVRNRAFDMVSNGMTFKLWIPPKNKFIVGRNDVIQPSKQPLENLRPQHIYDALLLRPVELDKEIAVLEQGYETIIDPKSKMETLQPEYVLDVIRRSEKGWFLSRKIYFNRTNLQPYRQVVYDQNGYVATDVRYEDFEGYQGVEFPSRITIWRPQEEYSVTLKILKLTINAPLTDEQFALNQPPGAQLVQLGSANVSQRQGQQAQP